MDLTTSLQILSVIIECVIVLIAVLIASQGRKVYGWLFALTFTLYVFFDLSRLSLFLMTESVSALLFLSASISALLAVLIILREVTGTTIRAIDREWL